METQNPTATAVPLPQGFTPPPAPNQTPAPGQPVTQYDVTNIMAHNFSGMLNQHGQWVRNIATEEAVRATAGIKESVNAMKDALNKVADVKETKRTFGAEVWHHGKTGIAVFGGMTAAFLLDRFAIHRKQA